MAELDLTNPSHLAELLRASLPGFDDETPEHVAPLVEALEDSDSDVFASVGRGQRPEPAPVEQQPAPQAQSAPPVQQSPVQQQPIDMGGEGLLLDDDEGPAAELGRVPVYARRGWTEIDRVRAKGKHTIYRLAASHTRKKPIQSKFIGNCQSVRVTLPYAKPDRDAYIGTWIGPVEARDHLLFSVEEVIDAHAKQFGVRLPLVRVDLITGARFRGRRFSPISIFLGYESSAENAKPTVYMLEGGSASGKAEALYLARKIDGDIKAQSQFKFTPFSCPSNWYEGGLALDAASKEPACVYLTAALTRDGRHEYLELSVNYEVDPDPKRVVHPFELQVEAAMRVLAIADETGCPLRVGGGGVLQHSLGPVARALIPWEVRPNGTTTPQERDMFCGCPKT